MSLTMTVDHGRGILLARAQGSVTADDVRHHIKEERNAGGLPLCELIDARGSHPEFSAEEVRDIVDVLRQLGRDSGLGPTAIVIDTDVHFGMMRMLEMLVEDVCQISPFRRMEDAEEWIAQFSKRRA